MIRVQKIILASAILATMIYMGGVFSIFGLEQFQGKIDSGIGIIVFHFLWLYIGIEMYLHPRLFKKNLKPEADEPKNRKQNYKEHDFLEYESSDFFFYFFSILAKVCKADGVVQKREIIIIETLMDKGMKLDSSQKKEAIRIFTQAKHSSSSAEHLAKELHKRSSDVFSHGVYVSITDFLFRVACADSNLKPAEANVIKQVARALGVTETEYENVYQSFTGISGGKEGVKGIYGILGCTFRDSNDTIKKNYRKLVKEYHPDTLVSKGLPAEMIEMSKQRFIEIQDAYDQIEKERGF